MLAVPVFRSIIGKPFLTRRCSGLTHTTASTAELIRYKFGVYNMLKLLKLIFISLIAFSSSSQANDSLKNAGEWMVYYYLKPNPAAFSQWIKDLSASGGFDKPSARAPIMIFSTEVVKKNPEMVMQWCKEISSLPSSHKAVIAWSIRNANAPTQNECIESQLGLTEEDRNKVLSSSRYDPISKEPNTPRDLDMLWAVFSATGSDLAVNRIIDVLSRPQPKNGVPGSVEIMVLKGAAKWSLSSNIQQHKRVKEIVKARQSKESGLLHKELQEVIENASSKPLG